MYSAAVDLAPDERRVAAELRQAVGQLVRRAREEDEVPAARLAVLGHLDRDGPLTVTELAARQRIRQQSVSRTVGDLLADGLLQRLPDPDDGRKHRLSLSAGGSALLGEERARRQDWLAEAMRARLSPVERRRLAAAVELLARLAEREGRGP